MSTDDLLQLISEIHFPGFFITVECTKTSDETPQGIEAFLEKKHKSILQGVTTRKFVFQDAGWRLIFTFFPTDSVVEERYALKNSVIKKHSTF